MAGNIRKYALLGAVCGIIVYIILCGFKTLNPFNYDWILNIYHDSTLSFLGWIFYEKAPYADGLFSCLDMSYPHSMSIIFSDAIAPFAIVLKPIVRAIIHEHTIFQYLGLWSLTCYMLQGGFSALLFYKTTENLIGRLVGIIICCFSPIMMQRLFVHNTLLAQWMILAALCICVYQNQLQGKKYLLWVLLFGAASMTHLYFVPMLALIFVPEMLYEITVNKKLKTPILTGLISLAFSLGVVALLGGFSSEISDADQAWSYTVLYKYSSNLMTGIISLGNSLLWPDLPSMKEEYEGFAYLGAGLIFGLLCFIVIAIYLKIMGKAIINNRVATIYSCVCIFISFIIGVGPKLTFFNYEIMNFNLPTALDYFFAIFRSIGRFTWVAYYIVIVGIISFLANRYNEIVTTIRGKKISWINFALVVVLIVQIIDLSPMIMSKRDALNNDKKWQTQMTSERWEEIEDEFDYIFIITAHLTSYPSQEAYSMYLYAYENDMKLTSSYFAHKNDTLQRNSEQYYEEILNGDARQGVLYWFENEEYYLSARNYIHCEKIDGYYVGWVE